MVGEYLCLLLAASKLKIKDSDCGHGLQICAIGTFVNNSNILPLLYRKA
jgi:hypothetical protein